MEIFGIRFVGLSTENGRKLMITFAFIVVFLILRYGLTALARLLIRGRKNEQTRFWIQQSVSLILALLIVVGFLSIWFDDPNRLATVAGFVSAGLAFALQKVVTSIAAYFVILRGQVFRVGDRILMSGVRGDVIALGFTRTTIMEMGQPPGERPDDPKVWIKSRQFTGRIVTVTNDKIFENPVFNYSRDFPYLWEELTLPIQYAGNRRRAEEIMVAAAKRNAVDAGEVDEETLEMMEREYYVSRKDMIPRVYYRLTDNWVELSLRFLAKEHGSRDMKDSMSREILDAFEADNIEIASSSIEIGAIPPLVLQDERTENKNLNK
ncbi:MAG TPA: mechanosensitive ion channel domain-containing protein [Pyrinomonadaceae bacterium]|jgi:small-conductance mechanosensitive channel